MLQWHKHTVQCCVEHKSFTNNALAVLVQRLLLQDDSACMTAWPKSHSGHCHGCYYAALCYAGCHCQTRYLLSHASLPVSQRFSLTTIPLDSTVLEGSKKKGGGDKNKCIPPLRESPCNDVIGYRLTPRVHVAQERFKKRHFNDRLTCLTPH